ncbi:MAG: DUF1697 domain-containing protein [Actinomycetota bacterium]
MTIWVALLRGVNVGGHNKVPMAELRAALGDAGLGEVTTYIASGNLVLAADDDPADAIAAVIADRFGLDLAVVTRTTDQLRTAAGANPFAELAAEQPKAVHCFFTSTPVTPGALDGFDGERYAPDRLEVAVGEVFAAYPAGMARSKLTNAVVDRVAGGPTTARNWNTVAKLVELATERQGSPATGG